MKNKAKDLKDLDLNTKRKDILEFCSSIPDRDDLNKDEKKFYLTYGMGLLEIRQEMQDLNKQSDFNQYVVENNQYLNSLNTKLVVATSILVLVEVTQFVLNLMDYLKIKVDVV